jgi:hypothetical protein
LRRALVAAALLLSSIGSALAEVHYVDVNSTNTTPPYVSWATAATNIQDAVDAAVSGDEILVTNGIYATGGRVTVGSTTNRVAVDKPLNLRSVNGPQFTTIDGGRSNRCVYLTNLASLSGFTLTNGRATQGGGLWCESTTAVVSNCIVSGNVARDVPERLAAGGGAYGGTLNNCVVSGNRATPANLIIGGTSAGGGAYGCALNNCTVMGNRAVAQGEIHFSFAARGGGAYGCTLNNCTVRSNSALANINSFGDNYSQGGGAYGCTLNNCALSDNSAYANGNSIETVGGGGAYDSTLNNCTLTGNSAVWGGGVYDSRLNNCTLTGNSATSSGGGVYGGWLNNCTLSGNSATNSGGGAYRGQLNNCTLTGNSASFGGGADSGGVDYGAMTHCISYFNCAALAGANYNGFWFGLNYCCTTPQPNGFGNITNAPLFVDLASGNLRLQFNSPCINAGNNDYASDGTDLDGNPRIVGGTVDIGAYEYQSLDLLNFGVVSNRFGFIVTGQSNWVIVLEASSNFTNWTALTTNTVGGIPFPFRDPTPPNLPQRFYRARQELP